MVERRRADPAFKATIVFITSVSAEMVSVNRGEYCVSKAGLSMAARLFAVRLAGDGVPVFEVRPGIIATDMTAGVRDVYDRRIADGLIPERTLGPARRRRPCGGCAGPRRRAVRDRHRPARRRRAGDTQTVALTVHGRFALLPNQRLPVHDHVDRRHDRIGDEHVDDEALAVGRDVVVGVPGDVRHRHAEERRRAGELPAGRRRVDRPSGCCPRRCRTARASRRASAARRRRGSRSASAPPSPETARRRPPGCRTRPTCRRASGRPARTPTATCSPADRTGRGRAAGRPRAGRSTGRFAGSSPRGIARRSTNAPPARRRAPAASGSSALVPSTVLKKSRYVESRLDENAMRRPSGAHTGLTSAVSALVTLTALWRATS